MNQHLDPSSIRSVTVPRSFGRGMACAGLIIFTLLACFFMLQYSSLTYDPNLNPWEQLAGFSPLYLLLNLLTLGVFLGILWIIFGRMWLAGVICSGVCAVLSIVNYFVIAYHGMPLSFQLLQNLSTAMNVISGYSFPIDSVVRCLIGVFLLNAGICLIYRKFLSPAVLSGKQRLIGLLIFSLYTSTVAVWGYLGSSAVKPRSTIGWLWSDSYSEYGFPACTVESFQNLFDVVSQPEGYSPEAVEAISIPEAADAQTETPDVILILNESYYDLSLISDVETDVDYLAPLDEIPGLLRGYAVVPGNGGGTNNSEYELLTSNSLYLMPGIVPFNTLDLNGANSIAGHFNALGYDTLGSHSESGSNYSRSYGYPALGFQKCYFSEYFSDSHPDKRGWVRCDGSLYSDLIRWYGEAPEDRPKFQYLLTIQNHGSWDLVGPEYDQVHTLSDHGSYNEIMNEYLTGILKSAQYFRDLTQHYAQSEHPVIICMVGDHGPNFLSAVASPDLTESEFNLLCRTVPLYIWANFPLEGENLGTMSMNYVVPTLLDLAHISLSPYYRYQLELKKSVPILTAYGSYFDAQGQEYLYDSDDNSPYRQAVDDYFYLEYYNLQSTRDQSLFSPD